MQALNIYTSPFGKYSIALLQDDHKVFDYREANRGGLLREKVRSVLVHSVMCASALTKIPQHHKVL